MRPRNRTILLLTGVTGGLAGMLAYALAPRPVAADLARVERGPMRVTVDEDGLTRVKERYVVSAPLGGRLARTELHSGDAVVAGNTVLASIEPAEPTLLDARSVAETEARVKAAEAAVERAAANLEKAEAARQYAAAELRRVRQTYEGRSASQQELDDAELKDRAAGEEFKAAQFGQRVSQFEAEQARAALLYGGRVGPRVTPPRESAPFKIISPVSGQVLRVIQESSAVVTAGTPLLEVGDPADLEVEVDVLSRDAVRVRPGAKVFLEEWGGPAPLPGRVRVVEPAAFTKVSALGVEEQRVWVIADIVEPPEQRTALGDRYRVEAKIVVWEGQSVLKVPVGALFRHGDGWAVFRVDRGRAFLRHVRVGQRNASEAEVLEGLSEGDHTLLYPSDRITEGVRVSARRGRFGDDGQRAAGGGADG